RLTAVGHLERPIEAADDADAHRVRVAEGVADRHHPVAGLHLARIAELDLGQRVTGFLGEFDEGAVRQRVTSDDARLVFLVFVLAVERDFNLGGALDHVVVGEDEPGLVDDEPGAGRLHDLLALAGRLLPALPPALTALAALAALAAAARARGTEEPLEEVAAAPAEEVGQVLRALPRLGA